MNNQEEENEMQKKAQVEIDTDDDKKNILHVNSRRVPANKCARPGCRSLCKGLWTNYQKTSIKHSKLILLTKFPKITFQ